MPHVHQLAPSRTCVLSVLRDSPKVANRTPGTAERKVVDPRGSVCISRMQKANHESSARCNTKASRSRRSSTGTSISI